MELLWYPHDVLKNKSINMTLEQINTEGFKQIVSRMFLIMYRNGGVGLAAPQLGFNFNLIVGNIDGRDYHDSSAFVLINPEIIYLDNNDLMMDEGCLSFPGIFAPVARPDKISVKFINVDGKELDFEVDGFLSRVIQHEHDHLNGILFTDRMSEDAINTIKHALNGHTNRVKRIRKKRIKEAKKLKAEAKKRANAKKNRRKKRD